MSRAGDATCARCDRTLAEGDRVVASDRVFCRSCYEALAHEVRRAVAGLSEDVNYPMAALGAVLGGVAGNARLVGLHRPHQDRARAPRDTQTLLATYDPFSSADGTLTPVTKPPACGDTSITSFAGILP